MRTSRFQPHPQLLPKLILGSFGHNSMDLALIHMFYSLKLADPVATLQLGRHVVENLDQRMWVVCTEYKPYASTETLRDGLHPWSKLNEYLEQHTHNGRYYICRALSEAWRRSAQTGLDLIKASLERGLNPDQVMLASDGTSLPLCYSVLYEIQEKSKGTEKKVLRPGFSEAKNPMHAPECDHQQDSTIPLWSILVYLIKAGADIFSIDAEDLDWATTWTKLYTLWTWAIAFNIDEEFLVAVEESGLDVDDFRWEDTYRCKQEIRLRGARRSGVDEEVLKLPSRSGLRCRPCRKKYCKRHDRGIFAYT